MNLSSVHVVLKVNVAEALMAKQLFSVYSNVTVKSTPKLYRIALKSLSKALYAAR